MTRVDPRSQYIGRVPEIGKGYWIGVEFETPEGKHDGSIGTVTYFQAKHAHGSFVRPDHIRRVGGGPGTTPGAVTGANKDSSTSPTPKGKPNLKLKGGAVMGAPSLKEGAVMGTPSGAGGASAASARGQGRGDTSDRAGRGGRAGRGSQPASQRSARGKKDNGRDNAKEVSFDTSKEPPPPATREAKTTKKTSAKKSSRARSAMQKIDEAEDE